MGILETLPSRCWNRAYGPDSLIQPEDYRAGLREEYAGAQKERTAVLGGAILEELNPSDLWENHLNLPADIFPKYQEGVGRFLIEEHFPQIRRLAEGQARKAGLRVLRREKAGLEEATKALIGLETSPQRRLSIGVMEERIEVIEEEEKRLSVALPQRSLEEEMEELHQAVDCLVAGRSDWTAIRILHRPEKAEGILDLFTEQYKARTDLQGQIHSLAFLFGDPSRGIYPASLFSLEEWEMDSLRLVYEREGEKGIIEFVGRLPDLQVKLSRICATALVLSQFQQWDIDLAEIGLGGRESEKEDFLPKDVEQLAEIFEIRVRTSGDGPEKLAVDGFEPRWEEAAPLVGAESLGKQLRRDSALSEGLKASVVLDKLAIIAQALASSVFTDEQEGLVNRVNRLQVGGRRPRLMENPQSLDLIYWQVKKHGDFELYIFFEFTGKKPRILVQVTTHSLK